ncbi:MAG TPA: histidine kinase dimerization/phospho-acceptor domain-containing protein, partial [Verrucomicrobiae bacterium]|nr:histidine kinase dimerization/phospho-acceptor domain-containing protein [Verrucomicrobiae bacterium]
MRRLIQRPLSLPKRLVTILAVALVAFIGVVDYRAGWEVHVTAFYLIPIAWTCWAAGRRAGLFVATVATAVWLIAFRMSGYTPRHPAIPYWNSLMLFAFFLVVVYLLSAFHIAHDYLEETVQQRTAALQAEMAERKRAEAAKLQAERLATAGTMAAEVAHEVRNPLGSITLNLDLIRKEIDKLAESGGHSPEEGRVLINEMREEVHRIQHVIEEYLQFARLPKAQRKPIDLNEFLDQKLAFMQSTFDEAKVERRTKFDDSLGTVNVDSDQLWQAVLNLIRNALDAMPNGGVLTVSTQRDADQVLLRITDAGLG